MKEGMNKNEDGQFSHIVRQSKDKSSFLYRPDSTLDGRESSNVSMLALAKGARHTLQAPNKGGDAQDPFPKAEVLNGVVHTNKGPTWGTLRPTHLMESLLRTLIQQAQRHTSPAAA